MTPDVASSLPGPAWLQDRRRTVAEQAQFLPLPTADEEIWRYSRIEELPWSDFTFAPAAVSVSGEADVISEWHHDDPVVDPADVFGQWNLALSEPTVLRTRRGQVVEAPVVIEHRVVDGSVTFQIGRAHV